MGTGMGSLGDSPAWGAAGEGAGKGLSAKIVEMRGLAGAVAGGWSRGWRGLTAPSGAHACPAKGMGSTALITALLPPLDRCRDQQGKVPAEPTQTAAGEAVSSRKPPSC